jgi:hypothetical protein
MCRVLLPLAGFQVIIYGPFRVFTGGRQNSRTARPYEARVFGFLLFAVKNSTNRSDASGDPLQT